MLQAGGLRWIPEIQTFSTARIFTLCEKITFENLNSPAECKHYCASLSADSNTVHSFAAFPEVVHCYYNHYQDVITTFRDYLDFSVRDEIKRIIRPHTLNICFNLRIRGLKRVLGR